MHADSSNVAPALRALLANFIDYAGIYPPAALPLNDALMKFARYGREDHSWLLRFLVVGTKELEQVPAELDGRISVITDGDEARAAAVETKTTVVAPERPVYCEVAVNNLTALQDVKDAACYAKIRTGGLTPEAIPSCSEVANFILNCAGLNLPFKATAGLHHPIRSEQALTYDKDAPRAVMHGFINVLMAAAFAWNGEKDIEPIVSEMDPRAFVFGENANWRDLSLSADQIQEARQHFIHSVGSCSFEEPVDELVELGFMPAHA